MYTNIQHTHNTIFSCVIKHIYTLLTLLNDIPRQIRKNLKSLVLITNRTIKLIILIFFQLVVLI